MTCSSVNRAAAAAATTTRAVRIIFRRIPSVIPLCGTGLQTCSAAMRSEQPVVKQTRMLSYARGPETPLLTDTIHQAFAKTAARVPQKTALIVRHQSVRLTFEHLAAEVERTARGLAGLGLRCDDRAGVWSTNCVEWVLLHLACARLGVVLVNVNPAYRAHELSYILLKSRMRALFLWEKH